MRDKMCNECKRCDGDLCTYFDNYSDRESTLACILFEPKKPTVFDKITENVEKLAEKLVYKKYYGGSPHWFSTILPNYDEHLHLFNTKQEAIAATIKELKKEVEDEQE